jgi:type I restriction-modification system DNA methylase subunit
MLDKNIKKKFDSAREILVGKIPDPTMQIEQITFAMIIKFMDEPKILPIRWKDLLDLKIDTTTLVKKYEKILDFLSTNKELPIFFSKIFKNAKLTFQDGNILRQFLEKINEFDYHKDSEILGEGYEYLLSLYGKQGALGQFRTPKHIIDFIVSVVEPNKNDSIHDPSCGTAGFLVSSINFIKNQNKDKVPGDKLRSSEKEKLFNSLLGFDVSPNMTRLALVNLWLHEVGNPNIQEYDSITNSARWNENYDVILANPPFMTPKGGIVPHSKFKNKSNHCADLFLDYLLQHLKPNGKAGIVIPDGILSVNRLSRKKLREDCLKNGLYAVCELHGFVFEPYAHVKTHIMFFDKSLKQESILFLDVNNDGFKLSRNRTEIDNNDLIEAYKIIINFKKNININSQNKISSKIINFNTNTNHFIKYYVDHKIMVSKPLILENKDSEKNKLHLDKISNLFELQEGSIASDDADGGEYILYTADEKLHGHSEYTHDSEAIILTFNAGGSLGRIHYASGKSKYSASNLNLILKKKKNAKHYVDLFFYSNYFRYIKDKLVDCTSAGVGKRTLNKERIKEFYISIFSEDYQKKAVKILKPVTDNIDKIEIEILEEKIKISKFFKQNN